MLEVDNLGPRVHVDVAFCLCGVGGCDHGVRLLPWLGWICRLLRLANRRPDSQASSSQAVPTVGPHFLSSCYSVRFIDRGRTVTRCQQQCLSNLPVTLKLTIWWLFYNYTWPHWLSAWPRKSSNFIFTTKMVFPKGLKFMNPGSESLEYRPAMFAEILDRT